MVATATQIPLPRVLISVGKTSAAVSWQTGTTPRAWPTNMEMTASRGTIPILSLNSESKQQSEVFM